MTQNIYLTGIFKQEKSPGRVIYPAGIEGSNPLMDIYEIRLQNLRALAAECGGRPALAQFMGMSYQLLNNYIGKTPTKKIGDKTSRRAEEVCGREYGWMDAQHVLGHDTKSLSAERINAAIEQKALAVGAWPFSFPAEKYLALPADKRARIDGYVSALIDEESAQKDERKIG